MDEPQSYAEAKKELQEILRRLDSNNLDVDLLDRMVERAAYLILFCRSRITQVGAKVERVMANLKQEPADEPQKRSQTFCDDPDIPF